MISSWIGDPVGNLAIFVGVIIVAAAAVWILGKRRGKSQEVQGPSAGQVLAFNRLATMCLGDRAKAQRLVDYERRKGSPRSEEQAILDAIERLQRDHR